MDKNQAYNIPPKPTLYNGFWFRSKLEAQWAVFFDNIGMKWEYESKRFEIKDNDSYLPDFYFPELEIFGEVKATNEQLFQEQKRISAAIDLNATPISEGLLIFGPIPYKPSLLAGCFLIGSFLYYDDKLKAIGDQTFVIYTIRDQKSSEIIGTEIVTGTSNDGNKPCSISKYPSIPETTSVEMYADDGIWNDKDTALLGALRLARSARFDFDDNVETMLKEGRIIIGGTKK